MSALSASASHHLDPRPQAHHGQLTHASLSAGVMDANHQQPSSSLPPRPSSSNNLTLPDIAIGGSSGSGIGEPLTSSRSAPMTGAPPSPEPFRRARSSPPPATIPETLNSSSSSSSSFLSHPPKPSTPPPPPSASTDQQPPPAKRPRFDAATRLCRTAYGSSRPHPKHDLLALYGLSPLVATVARVDLKTGEKINKLRKSYEGQLKTMGLAGRNKAVKHEDGGATGMSLSEMAAWPEEEWIAQRISGRDLAKGLSASATASLDRAMKLEPGSVPRNDEWENVLGHEKLKPATAAAAATPDPKGKAPAPIAQAPNPIRAKLNGYYVNGALPSSSSSGPTSAPADGESARPTRQGKKRRYNEESFEGYGEGFVDDAGDDDGGAGVSSDDMSKRGILAKKKRRKSSTLNVVENASDRSPYGAGPSLGGGVMQQQVGRGIGAYGGR